MLNALVAAFAVFLPLVSTPATPWDSWTAIGPACHRVEADRLVMDCESNALYGPQLDLTRGVRVSVEVLVAPGVTGAFWAGLALNADIPGDETYAQAALTQTIAPYWDVQEPSAVHLSTPASRCCDVLGPVDLAEWHTLVVEYLPGRATYSIDGYRAETLIDLGPVAAPGVLCVAVDPGAVSDARTHCEWKNLKVERL